MDEPCAPFAHGCAPLAHLRLFPARTIRKKPLFQSHSGLFEVNLKRHALASFWLDGAWRHPETFFFDAQQQLQILGDTLRLSIAGQPPLRFQFDMIPQDDGARIRLALTLTNNDAVPHEVGLGLLFDPALGQWGDGVAEINGQQVNRPTDLQTGIPETLMIWEREAPRKGLGIQFDVAEEEPDAVTFGNWFDLHTGQNAVVDALYDLAVRMTWDAATLNPGEQRSFAVDVALVEPDFPNGLFLRTDLPAFFSLENNLLFPRSRHAVVVLHNNSATAAEGVSLRLEASDYAEPAVPDIAYSVEPDNATYASVELFMPELFEDLVVTLRKHRTRRRFLLGQQRHARRALRPVRPSRKPGFDGQRVAEAPGLSVEQFQSHGGLQAGAEHRGHHRSARPTPARRRL